jgi:hypothetical protein
VVLLGVGSGAGVEAATCTGHGWWKQLRSDSGNCFYATIARVGAGACACVDDTWTSHLAFDTDSWDANDLLDVCGADFAVEITKPGGIPTMTLTPDGSGGSAMQVVADCWGDGWAEFTFPGDVADEPNCTDAVVEECDGGNGFTVRVECVETPWWCVDDSGLECVQSCAEPVGAVSGPYNSEAICSAVCSCVSWDAEWDGQNFWFCTSDTGDCVGSRSCTQLNADPMGATCICLGPYDTEEECAAACATTPVTDCDCQCCAGGIPRTLVVSCSEWPFSPGNAGCMDGVSLAINYDPVTELWTGSTTACSGQTVTASLACVGVNWSLTMTCGGSSTSNGNLTGSCDPLSLVFGLQFTQGACSLAVFSAVVTE